MPHPEKGPARSQTTTVKLEESLNSQAETSTTSDYVLVNRKDLEELLRKIESLESKISGMQGEKRREAAKGLSV